MCSISSFTIQFYWEIYENKKKEIKRLKHSVVTEREKHGSMEERNSELQRIVERVQNGVDDQSDLETQ